jgi:glucose-fructose oxidoreductase
MTSISRRNALKTLAFGSSATLFSPHSLLAATRRQKDKLGVALVGLGYYSTDILAVALQQTKHCYLAGIVTGTLSKAEEWKKKYNLSDKNIYNYQTFDTIANNPDIDIVYVVLPPSMHREYVVRAANAGKQVWCEKPMAVTEKECQEMIDACKKNKRSLAIGYRLQHEPSVQAYRRMVKEQPLGKVIKVSSGSGYPEDRTDHWKQKKEMGGGVMHDMGVYAIQAARMGTGMEPIAVVSAKTSTTRPQIYKEGVAETVIAQLEFPGGVLANIKSSFGSPLHYLSINCQKGDIFVHSTNSYYPVTVSSPLGEHFRYYQVPWQQANQMDEDAQAIMQNKLMLVPGEEGLRDIRIVEAIYKAAGTGQQVSLNR